MSCRVLSFPLYRPKKQYSCSASNYMTWWSTATRRLGEVYDGFFSKQREGWGDSGLQLQERHQQVRDEAHARASRRVEEWVPLLLLCSALTVNWIPLVSNKTTVARVFLIAWCTTDGQLRQTHSIIVKIKLAIFLGSVVNTEVGARATHMANMLILVARKPRKVYHEQGSTLQMYTLLCIKGQWLQQL